MNAEGAAASAVESGAMSDQQPAPRSRGYLVPADVSLKELEFIHDMTRPIPPSLLSSSLGSRKPKDLPPLRLRPSSPTPESAENLPKSPVKSRFTARDAESAGRTRCRHCNNIGWESFHSLDKCGIAHQYMVHSKPRGYVYPTHDLENCKYSSPDACKGCEAAMHVDCEDCKRKPWDTQGQWLPGHPGVVHLRENGQWKVGTSTECYDENKIYTY